MNIYFDSNANSIAIDRVISNLELYMPDGFTRVPDRESADLIILHAWGRNDHILRDTQLIMEQKKQYAVIQYAMKSTRNPDPKDWMPIWNNAKLVWSYYDLPASNLYLAPFAADPNTFFRVKGTEKKFLVGTLGAKQYYKAECFGEVHLAAFQKKGKVAHVGEKPNENPIVTYYSDISDEELRMVYNQCNWFSALRRIEGFEVVAIEALLCGTRPIMFGSPDYVRWFDGLAKFIPERAVGKTVKSLRDVLGGETWPVTDAEIEETKRRFNWKNIIEGFWERCI
jgi:hypothetical protein